jgi:hypothetical protein
VYVDDQETPNTQYASYNYGGSEITFEVRGLPTNGEASIQLSGPNYVGDIFLGEKGFMSLDHKGFQIFLGDKREPGESGMAEKGGDTGPHMTNFLEAVRSRRKEDLHADVEEGVVSVTLVHLANISYRLKRELEWDPATWSFKNDAEANAMRTRPEYRAPYIVPTIG